VRNPVRADAIRQGRIEEFRAQNIHILGIGEESATSEAAALDVEDQTLPTVNMKEYTPTEVPDSWEDIRFLDSECLSQMDVSTPASYCEAATSASISVASDGLVKLVRLTFSRNPTQLHELLQRHTGFKYPPRRLECRSYLFVPDTLHDIIQAKSAEMKLGPADVILTEDMETYVLDVVKSSLKRSLKISVKHRMPFKVDSKKDEDDEVNGCATDQDLKSDHNPSYQDCDVPRLHIFKTFIHVPVPSSLVSAPSGGPRTASTSDFNPRSRVKRSH
jgi:hypothetical protein